MSLVVSHYSKVIRLMMNLLFWSDATTCYTILTRKQLVKVQHIPCWELPFNIFIKPWFLIKLFKELKCICIFHGWIFPFTWIDEGSKLDFGFRGRMDRLCYLWSCLNIIWMIFFWKIFTCVCENSSPRWQD